MRRLHILIACLLAPLSLLYCDGSPSTPVDAGADVAAPYTQTLLDNARIGSDSNQPNFQAVTADVQLSGAPFASVHLVVDLTSTCFPWDQWKTDPPPSGQNWPASCDAFDRNFEMSLSDPANPGAPALEIVRAITPFGGPEHIEQDVTDMFNAIGGGKRTFEVYVSTYSDSAGQVSGSAGGWNVSAHLDVTPGTPPRNVLSVASIVYDWFDTAASGQQQSFPFTLPPNTTSTTIEYRVTGHGGASDTSAACIGPADEFCKRTHNVFVDGNKIDGRVPWRQDCQKLCTTTDGGPFGSYCAENPCGAPQSVQAPRANWCPGSETPPFTYQPALAPGDHTFAFTISSIMGQWRVSSTVYAFGD